MKHMKLITLLALVFIMQPAYARRDESGWMRKTARVVFYGAETAAGCHFFSAFYGRPPQSLWPWDIATKIWNDKRRAGSEALACFLLLKHGLRGLNKELHITEQFQ
jgi:hypothetical protein